MNLRARALSLGSAPDSGGRDARRGPYGNDSANATISAESLAGVPP